MTNNLTVYAGAQVAAFISMDERQQFVLSYDQLWVGSDRSFDFSPHLPRSQRVIQGLPVKNFIANLLPEGHALDFLARLHDLSKYDIFGLISKAGVDTAGALTIVASHDNTVYQSEPVALESLSAMFLSREHEEFPQWYKMQRAALSGFKHKIAVSSINKSWYLPLANVPSTHIIKPEFHANTLPCLLANEYFCLLLAKSVGINTVHAELIRANPDMLLIRRFDRKITGSKVKRLHQVDFAQAMGIAPERKYEDKVKAPHLCASMKSAFAIAGKTSNPALTRVKILDIVLFSYLIGNTNLHAKNLSLTIGADGVHLAPAYDLVACDIYDAHDLGLMIGGQSDIRQINNSNWEKFCEECAITHDLFLMSVRNLRKSIEVKSGVILHGNQWSQNEMMIISMIIDGIRLRSSSLESAAEHLSKSNKRGRMKLIAS